MKVIGLTGGIGAGKSIVAKVFEQLKIPVYNSDLAAKQLMVTDPELVSSIKGAFGEESYIDGQLNAPYIAQIVFNDKEKLEQLNQLVHPAVGKDFKSWCEQKSSPYVLKEAAIIYENNLDKDMDGVVVVSAPESVRIERVMKRDGVDVEAVKARMSKQMPQKDKDERADYLIINDGESSLIHQVLDVHEKIING